MQGVFLPKIFGTYDVGGFSVDLQAGMSVTDPHWHNGFEIIYIQRGRAELFCFDKWVTLNAGEGVILPPGYLHCVRCDDPDAEKSVIGFRRELIDIGDGIICAEDAASLLPNAEQLRPIGEIISALHRVADKDSESGRMICRGYILALWGRLIEIWNQMGSVSSTRRESGAVVKKIINYIREHLSENISPADVASAFGISYSHMARLFESENHAGFTKTVNLMRIDRAKKLLILGEGNVTEIAYSVGFSDTSYFTKLFRQYTGMTPLKYRRIAMGE